MEVGLGGEFEAADDVIDVRDVPGLGAVAEEFRLFAVCYLVGELGDGVSVLALVFLVAP